ncbi:MAG: protein kinase [Chromatiales bacterium]|nr:protein kinase [Chromatiales bacterium]
MEIPGYDIGDPVGKGGMATVYRAVQDSLGRPVALKVLSPEFADAPEFTQRFLNEGRMLASVVHRNVITIHDIGVVDGMHYIAMEYLEGDHLGKRIRKGLSVEVSVGYLLTLADALGVAHERGIVHRDLKPSNVLFRSDGTLLLSDFGIAKQLGDDYDLTVTGSAIGSPQYLSPEQARGKTVDPRADIYSLGIILFEMLTGSRPFKGDSSFETMMMHVETPMPPLPDWALAFQPVVDSMTAKDPDDRFPDVVSLRRALENALVLYGAQQTNVEETFIENEFIGGGPGEKWRRLGGTIAAVVTIVGLGSYLLFREPPGEAHAPSQSSAVSQDVGQEPQSSGAASPENTSDAGDERARQIRLLLTAAEVALAEYDLLTPPQKNAQFFAEKVLELDPSNEAALAMPSKIAMGYLQLARAQFNKNADEKAAKFVKRGLRVEPGHARLLALRAELEGRAQNAAASLQAPSPPVVVSLPPAPEPSPSAGPNPEHFISPVDALKKLFGK